MLSRVIAGVLAARLVLAPSAAADPHMPDGGPIAASAARQVESLPAPPPPARGPMPTGLKWTGIGLVIGSTGPLAIAKLGDCLGSRRKCRDARHGAYAASGVFAATGITLLAIGNAKRGPSPFATPIQSSATRAAEEAAAADPPRRRQVRHAPLWTGVGLIAGSGFPYLAASMDEGCERRACRNGRRVAYASAVGMGITGVALLSIGLKGYEPSTAPTLEVGDGRAAIVQRFRF
jgi:hypothetical protein